MDDLIEALQIFREYENNHSPTHCEHDELTVDVDPEDVSAADKERLEKLGFHPVDGDTVFHSFRFGSC